MNVHDMRSRAAAAGIGIALIASICLPLGTTCGPDQAAWPGFSSIHQDVYFLGWSAWGMLYDAVFVTAFASSPIDIARSGLSALESINLSPVAMVIAISIGGYLVALRTPPISLGIIGLIAFVMSFHPTYVGMSPSLLICHWSAGGWIWAAACLAAYSVCFPPVRRRLGLVSVRAGLL
jgi:hypothetical protein